MHGSQHQGSSVAGADGSAGSRTRDGRNPLFIREFLDHLVATGCIEQGASERAINAQRQTQQRIDVVLTELGLMSAASMLEALARYFGMPLARPQDMPTERILEDLLSVDFLRRNHIIPLSATDEALTFAVADPFEADALKSVAFLTEKAVAAKLAHQSDIDEALKRIHDLGETQSASPPAAEHALHVDHDDVQRLRDIASEAPIIRLVSRLITSAVSRRASDIHIEPMPDGLRVRFRIDGVMAEVERLPLDMQPGVASRIKILAKLNIAERRLPQDGRTKSVVGGREIDLRVSTMPVMHGESVVLRILDQSQTELTFPALGFDKRTAGVLERLLASPNGIVLVTGPTGSGKTTTLYAALKMLNSVERKVLTVEDPIEYQLPGINQIQVKPGIGLDFVQALRSILRQDPDVIMIGEMRDVETARIGIQASLTGHLVLSTLHTNSASASVIRLLDIGVEDYLLASTLTGVLAQRLVRRICDDCGRPSPMGRPRIEELLATLGRDAARSLEPRPREPVGCHGCQGTGFRGRTAITELLVIDEAVCRSIVRGTTAGDVERLARESGMETLTQNGVRKVLAGETTLNEVMRATSF